MRSPTTSDSALALEREALWTRVYELVGAMDLSSILAHKVGPLAAQRWRAQGRELPAELAQQERAARFVPRLALSLLTRARQAHQGRMLLLKGPEIAALFPAGGRTFTDLDVLVDDAPAAQEALLAIGFAEVDDRQGHRHHLTPLVWPGVPLTIELHSKPKWPSQLGPSPSTTLFEGAVQSALPIAGLEAPRPAHHALVAAAHAWAHMPLGSLRDLIDVAVLAQNADRFELDATAEAWGAGRMWQTTTQASRWLLEGDELPTAVRLWARHLLALREPTVVESHARRWLAPFWMLPPARGARLAARNIAADFRRQGDEPWRHKLQRILRAATYASRSQSERGWQSHEEEHWS